MNGGQTSPLPIVHHDLAVLKVADPHVFEEIRAVLPLDDFVFAELSETELVIDPRRLRELVSRLDASGMAPLLKREG
ncbi:MAG: hypothetical protein H6741_22610 [Alphaproteobacteria bacterium]|nr:hypothetical protein [Alphaproteobacteria bacterium]